MKALVAYYSQTGNTKKVAKAIYDELDCDKEFLDIKKVKSLDYDIVFFGCPVQPPYPPEKIKKHLEKLKGKTALFMTHAAPEGAPPVKGWMDNYTKHIPGKIVGQFDCQGQLSFIVKLIMKLSPDPQLREWAKMDNSKGQPDASRLKKAAKWAKRLENSAGSP